MVKTYITIAKIDDKQTHKGGWFTHPSPNWTVMAVPTKVGSTTSVTMVEYWAESETTENPQITPSTITHPGDSMWPITSDTTPDTTSETVHTEIRPENHVFSLV